MHIMSKDGSNVSAPAPFQNRLLPAPKAGGFRMEDYWVWCGSVVRGEDGRYHMFAARWPKAYPFFKGYQAASEVVRAVADRPEGPFVFEEVVLPARGGQWWDGRMTHNPFIIRYGDEYLLFYIGATYAGPTPAPEELHRQANAEQGLHGMPWYSTIRIGMARSRSVFGPWRRPDQPTLDIQPQGWDRTVVTNPTPCVAPDGRILLYYRSTGCKLGLAAAPGPDAPFRRVGDRPVVDPGDGLPIEDPFVFWNGACYEMVCKDLSGKLTGEYHAGVHLTSPDARTWAPASQPKAWSRNVLWNDGTSTLQSNIERPFILFENGEPAWLYAATANGPGPRDGQPGFNFAANTWNMAIPLAQLQPSTP
jgi:hypothetical protein